MTHIIRDQIRVLEIQLRELDIKKLALQEELKNAYAELEKFPSTTSAEVQNTLSPKEKIKIFMNFFRGRADVFPKRWDNPKTGKSGFSPACSNEWVKGTCNKPRIKCSECPHQAFIPLSEEIVRKHLGGEDFNGSSSKILIKIGKNYCKNSYFRLETSFFLVTTLACRFGIASGNVIPSFSNNFLPSSRGSGIVW
jgi:hypothetical protein